MSLKVFKTKEENEESLDSRTRLSFVVRRWMRMEMRMKGPAEKMLMVTKLIRI